MVIHKPTLSGVAAVLAGTGLVFTTAFAENAHFVIAPSGSIDNGTLTISWKEAGLGNTPVTYQLVVQTLDFTYQCFTKSNNKPEGAPNSGGESQASTTTTITPRNGEITGSLSISPELPPPDAMCQGNGLKLCLTAVSYQNVMFEDETNELVGMGTEDEETETAAPTPTPVNFSETGLFACTSS